MPAAIALAAVALSFCCVSAASGQTTQEWTFTAGVSVYQLPDDRNYAQPTVTADRGRLHLEGRYNNEAFETGSAWVGYNLGGGERVAWELTPMVGGVFGREIALAPGYRGSVSWWRVEFSSEGQFVFGSLDEDESFVSNWSELSFAPGDWWRLGIVTERTRVYEAEREVQRGVLAGFSFRNFDAAVYVFNPDDSEPIVVVGATVSF